MTGLLLLLAVLAVAYAVALAHPVTRPYARRAWWLVLLAAAVIVGAMLRGPRRLARRSSSQTVATVAEVATLSFATIADEARAQLADADAELGARRIAAQSDARRAALDLHEYQAGLVAARREPDPVKRRAALRELVARAPR